MVGGCAGVGVGLGGPAGALGGFLLKDMWLVGVGLVLCMGVALGGGCLGATFALGVPIPCSCCPLVSFRILGYSPFPRGVLLFRPGHLPHVMLGSGLWGASLVDVPICCLLLFMFVWLSGY